MFEKFASKNVRVIVLKGAALAETIYENIAARPMADVDILVQKKDVDDALNLLTALGYERIANEARPGITTTYENELVLQKSGRKNVLLELHWSLFTPVLGVIESISTDYCSMHSFEQSWAHGLHHPGVGVFLGDGVRCVYSQATGGLESVAWIVVRVAEHEY